MAITAYLRKEKFEFEEKTLTANELLEKMGLSPQAFLLVRNKGLLTGRELINDGEEVRIIAVISGG